MGFLEPTMEPALCPNCQHTEEGFHYRGVRFVYEMVEVGPSRTDHQPKRCHRVEAWECKRPDCRIIVETSREITLPGTTPP